ncbi:unnamed protein product [Timema podura]|uniref:Uncharacterized protein n=1 Tax=Timema podura TaxID=61482 RepID=A0ABN7NHR3_TIMPD|nr:unnamed protein product [Timema podura]
MKSSWAEHHIVASLKPAPREIVPVSLLYRVNIGRSNWTINEYWLEPDKNEYWLAPPRELYYQQASKEQPSFISILSSNGSMHFNPGSGKRKETPCSGITEVIKENYRSSHSKNNKVANYKYVDRLRHALKDISKHRLNVSQKSKPKASLEEIVSHLKKRNSKHIEKQMNNNVRNLYGGTPKISPKRTKIINFFTTCGQMDVEEHTKWNANSSFEH